MRAEEREKLFSYDDKYIGIGVSKGGERYNAISVPWEHTGNAFNMRTPDVYLERSDLDDEEILAQLERFHVIGCYIFEGLEDYSFLARFTEIQDLYIREAENLTDLSFMLNMEDWFMLLLEGAHLKNLQDICPREGEKPKFHSFCMAFYDCQVEDVSAIEKKGIRLSELIIWNKKTEEDYQKWKSVPAHTFRYFDKEK